MSQPFESFKVVVLGNKDAGKTSLVLRYIEGQFTPNQESTVGAFFLQKRVKLADDREIKMQVWDTAGQERFRAMAPMYYRGASCAVVCFDITNEDSFTKMKDWVDELKNPDNPAPQDIVLAIASNKSDLESERKVSKLQAKKFASEVGALFFETSAKENTGVSELFKQISETVIRDKGYLTRVQTSMSQGRPTQHILDASPPSTRSNCC